MLEPGIESKLELGLKVARARVAEPKPAMGMKVGPGLSIGVITRLVTILVSETVGPKVGMFV